MDVVILHRIGLCTMRINNMSYYIGLIIPGNFTETILLCVYIIVIIIICTNTMSRWRVYFYHQPIYYYN